MLTRYSLTAGLFSMDEKGEARDLAATLEAIAAAGFDEVELMAEGAEWEKPGEPTTRDRAARRWSERGSGRTRSTPP